MSASTVSMELGSAHAAASIAHGMRPSKYACALAISGKRATATAGGATEADASRVFVCAFAARETSASDSGPGSRDVCCCCFSGGGFLLDEMVGTALPELDRNMDTDLGAPIDVEMDSICSAPAVAVVLATLLLVLEFTSLLVGGPSENGPDLRAGELPFSCARALSRSSDSAGVSENTRVPVYEYVLSERNGRDCPARLSKGGETRGPV